MQILAISGSLRRQSGNLTLLERAGALAPHGLEITVFTGLEQVPLFNPDLEELKATHAAGLVGAHVRQNDLSVDLAVQAALAALKSESNRLDHSR